MIIQFRQTMLLESAGGDYVDERTCLEYPRISHTQTKRGDLTVTAFRVAGVTCDFMSIGQALEALRLHPWPTDIVAVPPITTQESAC